MKRLLAMVMVSVFMVSGVCYAEGQTTAANASSGNGTVTGTGLSAVTTTTGTPTATGTAVSATGVAATSTGVVAKNEMNFTMDEALAYAVSHNSDILIYEEKIRESNISLEDALDSTEKAEDAYYGDVYGGGSLDSQVTQSMAVHDYYKISGESNHKFTLLGRDQKIKTVKYNVQVKAYDIQTSKNNIAINDKNIELLKKQLEIMETKLKLNMATETQKQALVTQLSNLQLAQDNAKNTLATQETDLKILLGVDKAATVNIKLDPKYVEENIEAIDIEAVIKKALDTRLDNQKLQLSIKLAAIELQSTKSIYGEGSDKAISKQSAYNQTVDSASNTVTDIKEGIRTMYNGLKSAKVNYLNQVEATKLAEKNYNIDVLMFKLGMKSKVDMMSSEINYITAQNKLYDSLTSYLNTRVKYEIETTYGSN